MKRQLTLIRIPILFLGVAAFIMAPPLVMALALGESAMIRGFALPMGAALGAALPVAFASWVSARKGSFRLHIRDGFLLVFLTWVFISLWGSLPYYLSGHGISLTDAVFESTCGFATTGATTVADVEALPRSLLLWRSLTHWFGGMGIVLFTVALMPLLGAGGFQLIKAETPGPEKEKLTPKVTAAAQTLWLTYCTLTAVLVILYRAGGMGWFDAFCHSFTTMASGGVSTKNSGIAWFDSRLIDAVTVVFMLLAGLNFNLYYRLLKGKVRDIVNNTEGRAYLLIFIITTALVTASLIPRYGSAGTALRYASFQCASILSTTGNAAADYGTWPVFAQMVLLALMFVGGCSSSTAGGVKVIRHVVLWKQTGNELRRAIYPWGVFSVRLNKKVGRKDVVYGVAGFVFLYALVVTVTTLVTAASGTDLFSSFSAALSVTGNIGAGFGAVGPGRAYAFFPNHVKWLFSLVMIAGRLELWTVFILFSPEYWRR